MKIAENLKKIRESRNLSQAELAVKSGVSQTLITHIENGLKIPSLATCFSIAEVLGTTVDELCKGA